MGQNLQNHPGSGSRPNLPLVVLINRNSASASEIVAGALQDLDRAVIIGERSYGKGLVQSSRNLPYDGTLKVTISKYYIPSGRLIQAIDYTHRNEDGSVARVPKEKMKEFKTANGRSVYDGGGIMPDKEVESQKMKNIVFYLLSDFVIFDYATQYVNNHPTIAPIAEYTFTDEDFNDFKQFVQQQNFTYDKQSEKAMKELRSLLEFEGYYDGAKEEFARPRKETQPQPGPGPGNRPRRDQGVPLARNSQTLLLPAGRNHTGPEKRPNPGCQRPVAERPRTL